MVQQSSGLEWLISPLSLATFQQSFWDRQHWRGEGRSPSYYDGVFPTTALDDGLFSAVRFRGSVEILAADERPRPALTVADAVKAVESGHSLRIDALQRFNRTLQAFSRSLEQDLSCLVNINLYLTPNNSQALALHYDTHDVFVLQILGTKRWTLFGPPQLYPLEYAPPLRCERPDRVRHQRLPKVAADRTTLSQLDDFSLAPGDCLYLPRGVWHEVRTEDSVSCHLTVGLQTFTYLDLATIALTEAAGLDSALRASLPWGFATSGNQSEHIAAQLTSALMRVQESVPDLGRRSVNVISDSFLRSRAPLLSLTERLATSGHSNEDAQSFRRASGLICRVQQSPDSVSLSWSTGSLRLPVDFAEALGTVAALRIGQTVHASSLGGNISEGERSSLLSQLSKAGVLEPVRDISGPRWWPTRVRIKSDGLQGYVNWIEDDGRPFDEPFFAQSVARMKRNGMRFRRTSLGAFRAAPAVSPLPIRALVFHVSRCGSTLLANMLRAIQGNRIVSEPAPISDLLRFPAHATDPGRLQIPTELVRQTAAFLSDRRFAGERSCTMKFSSWNILFINELRRLWPDTPCIVVIRDPVEVLVSCLRRTPGWFDLARSDEYRRAFGSAKRRASSATGVIDAAAWVLSHFYDAARQTDPVGRVVVDYGDLSPDRIAALVNNVAKGDAVNGDELTQCRQYYSKDGTRTEVFTGDSAEKQAAADDDIRAAVEDRIRASYEALLKDRLAVNNSGLDRLWQTA